MDGSLKKYKEGIFHFTISLGPDPDRPGKYKQKKFTIRAENDRELKQKKAAIILDLEFLAKEKKNITVEKHLENWIEDCKKRKLGRRTVEEYEKIIKNHINPTLGKVQITKLTPKQLRDLIELKYHQSQYTAKKIYIIFNNSLKRAMADDELGLKENICTRIIPPKLKKVKHLRWTADQSLRFLKLVEGNRYYGVFLCCLTTGMRIGEVAGLRWLDIDTENKTINIQQKLEKKETGNPKPQFGKPKTEASEAQILMTDILAIEFAKIETKQENEKAESGKELYNDRGLIFTGPGGKPVDLKSLDKWAFKNNIQKYNKGKEVKEQIPIIRIHDMRHSAATILLKLGVPLDVIQRYLRHANRSTTEIYAHNEDVELLREATNKMGELFKK
jgi:integrase